MHTQRFNTLRGGLEMLVNIISYKTDLKGNDIDSKIITQEEVPDSEYLAPLVESLQRMEKPKNTEGN